MEVLLTKYDGAILGPIAKLLGYILDGIYSFFDMMGIHNAGICIILFTFIINALIIPLTIKQQKFSKMNSIVTPEIQAIQAKYRNKKDRESVQKMQIEQQEVYSKYGVSPTAGCLPMLITLPIFFALYRVIYNVPAYVPDIKEIYENIINTAAASGIDITEFCEHIAAFVKNSGIELKDAAIENPVVIQSISKSQDIVTLISQTAADGNFTSQSSNYIVDILSQFKLNHWETFSQLEIFKDYPAISDTINSSYKELTGIYNFCGMNIMENSRWNDITISIPILAVVTQFINNKIVMKPSKNNESDKENSVAQSMGMMNNIMPFMSGIFCFMFPIGVGLYWVAGNIFRTVQGVFINMYFDKIGMDKILEKNKEKQIKKLEKKGIDVNSTKMKEIARQKTSSVNTAVNKKSNSGSYSGNGSKNDFYINKNIKNGSISDFANMLNRDYKSSEEIENEEKNDDINE